MKIDGTGRLDILSAKLLINGDNGDSGQVLTTDGLGNISWTTPATAQHAFANISVTGQTTIQASSTETIEFEAGSGISITTNTGSNPKKAKVTIATQTQRTKATFCCFKFNGGSVGSNAVADSETDTLTLVAGNNITLTNDSNNDQTTIEVVCTGSGTGSQNLLEIYHQQIKQLFLLQALLILLL